MSSVGLSGRPAVRPSGRPSVCIQNLNIRVYAFVIVATFLKLGRVIPTLDLYAQVPLLVTSDL